MRSCVIVKYNVSLLQHNHRDFYTNNNLFHMPIKSLQSLLSLWQQVF